MVNIIEDKSDKIVRAWITKDVEKELGVKPGEWIFLQEDRFGVKSTRALIEDYLPEKGLTVKLTSDRIKDGLFNLSKQIRASKVTEWE